MIAFWQMITYISVGIISVSVLIIGLALVHCRRHMRNRDTGEYIIERDQMAGPYHYYEDSLTLSLPPLPPTYYYISHHYNQDESAFI